MSPRNLVLTLAVSLLALALWYVPDTVNRNRSVYRVFSPLVDIRTQIKSRYVEDIDDDELVQGAIQGMLDALDPYSRYISPSELDAFNQETSGIVPGIGVVITLQDGMITVISPIEDSPAFQAGIMPGDRILAIGNEPTKSMTLSRVADKLRGEPGTSVSLEIRHEHTGRMETVRLTRREIHIRSVKGVVRRPDGDWDMMLDRDSRIGYLRITNFVETTGSEMAQAVMQLGRSDVRGIIIDLRNNPGGLLEQAVNVSSLFLPQGVIVTTKGRWAPPSSFMASGDPICPRTPIVILINRYTASAAEIVSGALKDHRRATLVGARTYGKGTVQSVFPLEDNRGAIKITTAYYYLPNGRNIHRRKDATLWGVDPDIDIELTTREFLELQHSRAQADLLFVPKDVATSTVPTSTAAATATAPAASAATAPTPILIDRQLARALQVLQQTLATQPADVADATTSPTPISLPVTQPAVGGTR
jgi:carboxyl-terminal processing protease